MSRSAKLPARRGQARSQPVPSGAWDLHRDRRFDDPGLNSTLAMYFAELSRAQREKDVDGAASLKSAIQEVVRDWSDDEIIDVPLEPLLRKARKRAAG